MDERPHLERAIVAAVAIPRVVVVILGCSRIRMWREIQILLILAPLRVLELVPVLGRGLSVAIGGRIGRSRLLVLRGVWREGCGLGIGLGACPAIPY